MSDTLLCPRCLLAIKRTRLQWRCRHPCGGPGSVFPPPGTGHAHEQALSGHSQWRRCRCDKLVTQHVHPDCGLPLLHETMRDVNRIRHVVILSDGHTPLLVGRVQFALAAALAQGLAARSTIGAANVYLSGALTNPAAWALCHRRVLHLRGHALRPGQAPAAVEARSVQAAGTRWFFHAWPLQADPKGCGLHGGSKWRGRLKRADEIVVPAPPAALTDGAAASRLLDQLDRLAKQCPAATIWLCHLNAGNLADTVFGPDIAGKAEVPDRRRDFISFLLRGAWRWISWRAGRQPSAMPNACAVWPSRFPAEPEAWPLAQDAWLHAGLSSWTQQQLRHAAV